MARQSLSKRRRQTGRTWGFESSAFETGRCADHFALAYVAAQSSKGAASIGQRLNELMQALAESPRLGITTDEPGVRRITLNPYPYLIDYWIHDGEIIVLRFRHGARRS